MKLDLSYFINLSFEERSIKFDYDSFIEFMGLEANLSPNCSWFDLFFVSTTPIDKTILEHLVLAFFPTTNLRFCNSTWFEFTKTIGWRPITPSVNETPATDQRPIYDLNSQNIAMMDRLFEPINYLRRCIHFQVTALQLLGNSLADSDKLKIKLKVLKQNLKVCSEFTSRQKVPKVLIDSLQSSCFVEFDTSPDLFGLSDNKILQLTSNSSQPFIMHDAGPEFLVTKSLGLSSKHFQSLMDQTHNDLTIRSFEDLNKNLTLTSYLIDVCTTPRILELLEANTDPTTLSIEDNKELTYLLDQELNYQLSRWGYLFTARSHCHNRTPHHFFHLTGVPGSGKGQMKELMKHVFGSYFFEMQNSHIYKRSNDFVNWAPAVGSLVMVKDEVGDIIDANVLNLVTDHAEVTQHRKGHDQVPITPTGVPILISNNLLKFSEKSNEAGIARRKVTEQFVKSVFSPDGTVDSDKLIPVAETIINNELDTLAFFVISGFIQFLQNPTLQLSDHMCIEKTETNKSNSPFDDFISSMCEVGVGQFCTSSELLKAYSKFCEDNNEFRPTSKKLISELRSNPSTAPFFKMDRTMHHRLYRGISLKASTQDNDNSDWY